MTQFVFFDSLLQNVKEKGKTCKESQKLNKKGYG